MFHRQQHTSPADEQQEIQDNKTETDVKEKETEKMAEDKAPESEKAMDEPKAASRPLDIPGGAGLQRSGQSQMGSAPRVPGYPGSSYSTPMSSKTEDMGSANSNRLIIGQGITMSGEIEACDTLVVEGTVEAALKGASVLMVAESGVFYGTVEIDEATISGRFEGDITVQGRLTITETGSVTGTISYKELAVEAGGIVDGKLVPLAAKAAGGSSKPKSKTIKSSAGKNDNQDDELPLTASA